MIYKTVLKGKKVNLRPLRVSDASMWVKWLGDSEVSQYISAGPITLAKEKVLLKKIIIDPNKFTFAIETKKGKHIGGASLNSIIRNSRAELGIIIGDKEYWSKGYGTDVISILLKFGFEQLKLKRIFLRCIEFNKRGIRCYEKCGFVHEGRLRKHMYKKSKYWDEIVMSILINEYNKKYGKRKQ